MEEFLLVTDSTADLPEEYLKEHDITCMNLSYIVDGVTYGNGKELDWKQFYAMMREGKMPTTSQVNPTEAKSHFEKLIQESSNILYLAFSSGLSGTYNSGCIAAQEVMEEHPGCRIEVIDTLGASMGEGLLVHKAVRMKEQGKSMDEIIQWVRENIQNITHVFTVDDLNHLHRGGRVSKAVAIIGTLAAIKPMMHVDEEGHLTVIGKVRGRKKSLNTLVDYMEDKVGSYLEQNREDMVFISHGDALEDAEYVREQIRERFGCQHFMIHNVGPTIGAHSGPGTIALFFMGESR